MRFARAVKIDRALVRRGLTEGGGDEELGAARGPCLDRATPGGRPQVSAMPHSVPPRTRASFYFLSAGGALALAVALFSIGMVAYHSANLWVDHTVEVRKEVYEWL